MSGPQIPGIGGHTSARRVTNEWLTPPEVLAGLGDFDLDPCASIIEPGWVGAPRTYTEPQDGLTQPWGALCPCPCHSGGAPAADTGGLKTSITSLTAAAPSNTSGTHGASGAVATTPAPARPPAVETQPSAPGSSRRSPATPAGQPDGQPSAVDPRSTTTSESLGLPECPTDGEPTNGMPASVDGAAGAPTAARAGRSSKTTSFPSATPVVPGPRPPTSSRPAAGATGPRVPGTPASGTPLSLDASASTCAACAPCPRDRPARVFLNPPYSDVEPWMAKMAEHGHGTALLFARCDTATWFRFIWPHAAAYLFLAGRLTFWRPTEEGAGRSKAGHNSGGPSVLIAYGDTDAEQLRTCGLAGAYLSSATLTEISHHAKAR